MALSDVGDVRPVRDIAIRTARERWLAGDPSGQDGVRRAVLSSWRRCRALGVAPSGKDVPHNPEFDGRSRLVRAAEPVLDDLAEQLEGYPATIVLAGADALILQRRAGGPDLMRSLDRAMIAPGFSYAEEHTGTNGIGTPVESGKPFLVSGGEHFRDNLQEFTCMGAPVRHPISGAVEGVLDVTCRRLDDAVLLQPIVLNAARAIEARMFEQASLRERMLLEHFLEAARRNTAAVVSVNPDMMMANTAAARLLGPDDQMALWEWASQMLADREEYAGELRVGGDTVRARCTRIGDGPRTAGVIVEMRRRQPRSQAGCAPRPGRRTEDGGVPMPGRSAAWERLRDELEMAAGAETVLVVGERGAGKLHVARYLCRSLPGGHQPVVLDATSAGDQPAEWLAGLREARESGEVVVLRRLDRLPAALHHEVEALLEHALQGGPQVIATARDDRAHDGPDGLWAYFRFQVAVPALRHRPEDIPDIAAVVLRGEAGSRRSRLQPGVLQAFMALDWPGNVRELKTVLTAAAVRAGGGDIGLSSVPQRYRCAPSRHRLASLERAERDAILQTLADLRGNKQLAAKRLGIARSTLYRKMRAFGIDEHRLA